MKKFCMCLLLAMALSVNVLGVSANDKMTENAEEKM